MRIGIDLGGTKIEALALSAEGRELERIRIATPRGDYGGTLEAIRSLVWRLERELGETGAVGGGIPGTVALNGFVEKCEFKLAKRECRSSRIFRCNSGDRYAVRMTRTPWLSPRQATAGAPDVKWYLRLF